MSNKDIIQLQIIVKINGKELIIFVDNNDLPKVLKENPLIAYSVNKT